MLRYDSIDPRSSERVWSDLLDRENFPSPSSETRASRDAVTAPTTPRVLVVSAEWASARGGISTFSRILCLALAAVGCDVVCLVPSAAADEIEQADAGGVRLVAAVRGADEPTIVALSRRPSLPGGFRPDRVIGHGRVTGPAARVLVEDHFPEALRLHFLHVAPDHIEWDKAGRLDDAGDRAEARTRTELDLCRGAHRVVAVGPLLYGRYLTDLVALGLRPPLRFDPGFDEPPVGAGVVTAPVVPAGGRHRPPGQPLKIYLAGRMEDARLKGVDLAASAVGLVARRRGPVVSPLELVIRGADQGTSQRLRDQIRVWSSNPALGALVRPYTCRRDELAADLLGASLAVMPSRSEGFGLFGAEALMAGTPVLVSGASGLGMYLNEVLPADAAARSVVPMSGDDDEDVDRWARAIEAVLHDLDAAFHRADELRRFLAGRTTWAGSARSLLAGL